MTRGKQKKNCFPFVKNFTKEEGRGHGRGRTRGGKSSLQIFYEEGIRESTLAGVGATPGGRGKKRGESFQVKYARRYDELLQSESVYQAEISNLMSLRPHSAKRKSHKGHGAESRIDAVRESGDVNDESSRKKNSGARKSHKVRRSGTETYNTTVYNYMDGEVGKTIQADEIHSSDMDANPEVVLPGNEYWAEAVIDRCGNIGNLVISDPATEITTWGLGYVQEETLVNINEESAEMSKETATAQELDEHNVEALSDPLEMYASHGKDLGQLNKTRKGRRNSVPKAVVHAKRYKPRKDENRRGFLSIGGLNVYTSDISDMSDDEDSCTDHMEGFADKDDGDIGCSRKHERGKKRIKDLIARKKYLSSPDPRRFSAIMLDSSDGDDSLESSNTDISNELVDDYLANCEGLSADIDDPNWVSRNQKSLEYPFIDEMDILEEESGSSEELDLDQEDNDSDGSGSELEDDIKHRYEVTAGVHGRQVIRKRRSEETSQGDSDVEIEDLEQKAIFGYDSDSSGSGGDKQDALLSDDEVRIRDLELDDEARIRDLGIQDNASASAKTNMTPKYRAVGGFVSGPTEDVQLTSSVATQTWFVSTGKSVKKTKGVPGQKKKDRQETISAKRRERAINRGFDLAAVNKELEDMVRLRKDIIAFAPMELRDRAQVRRLASIYKLQSDSQGTTKRRFVVVSITKDTGMPSAEDKVRLLKLLGQARSQNVENTPRSSRPLTGEEQRKVSKMKRAARQALQGLETPVSRKGSKNMYFSSSVKTPNSNHKGRSADKSRGRNSKGTPSGQGSHMKRSDKKASKTAILHATNPVTFIGRGPEGEDAFITTESTRSSTPASTVVGVVPSRSSRADVGFSGAAGRESSYILKSNSTEFAVFEAHTTGFASRMMEKMGYVKDHGLGREKQGIIQPLEAVMRPKSLGLGARP
ncbi:hypothetical protein Mapa_011464 [Marchantia paleacea]|nr:hypothetical protein Mapa_011464 [Marchantia paleacea]